MDDMPHPPDAFTATHVTIASEMGDRSVALDALVRAFDTEGLDVDGRDIRRALEAREALASTNVGDGVALPHARLPGLGESRLAVVIVREGVDFQDGGDRVHIVAGLLGDDAQPRAHLRALAQLARALSLPAVRLQLVQASDPREVLRGLGVAAATEVERAA